MRRFILGVVVGVLVCYVCGMTVAHPAAQSASTLPPILTVGAERRLFLVTSVVMGEMNNHRIIEIRGDWLRFDVNRGTMWVNAVTGTAWVAESK